MKKTIALIIVTIAFLLSACSVQENVSPQLFMKRLQRNNENIVLNIEGAFVENNKNINFIRYKDNADFVIELTTDKQGNATKICLACVQSDKSADFKECAQSIIETYAPNDDYNKIMFSLFENENFDGKYRYFSTQWYRYSAVFSENGCFFSVDSVKLIPSSEVEMSLKENDIIEY